MSTEGYQKQGIASATRQSPPLEFPGHFEDAWLAPRTILITGGASGFGAAFVRRWAAAGATVVFGDISEARGRQLAAEVRRATGNARVHFEPCDVTRWPDQVRLFRRAVAHSPHGGLDAVVASAGIADTELRFERPGAALDAPDPPEPNLAVLDVNLRAVALTAHLALHHLPRNPGAAPADPARDPATVQRDRHLLLLGSMASLAPIPAQALYGAAKHGVAGLFRCLRATSHAHGVRVSLLAPYFVDTPMLGAGGRAFLAGAPLARLDDVVEAATRLTADASVVGRAVCVGPRLVGAVREGESAEAAAKERGAWEVFPDDLEDSEVFGRRVVRLMNIGVAARGWLAWAQDIGAAVWSGLVPGRRR